ncbi:MAG: cell wall-binding repeat-containing protein, partial [Acidimicrobiales bacterium]
VLTETTTGSVPGAPSTGNGYICITTVTANAGFTTSATQPTLTVSPSNTGGTATVSGAVNGVGSPGAHGFTTIEGDVLSPSSTVPTTFTFAGLTVDAPNNGPVTVNVFIGASANCVTTPGTLVTVPGNPDFSGATGGALTIYAVGNPTANSRIAGSDADQTAVAALEFQYPPTPGFCIDQGTNPDPNKFNVGSTVVVATDGSWQDALTASYLASYFGTGVLLTPTGTLSSYTAEAIQAEGVSNVIIVGGSLAVSNAVQTQLSNTNAYLCGGGTPQMTALGTPLKLNVQRLWGNTADDTAQAVDTFVNSGFVGRVNIADAFGKYNDTTGTDSGSAPTVQVRTAILVTDGFFQDASSASAMSYFDNLPIVLTPTNSLGTQAETTLLDLGIQQVIELGGPLAIADSVNASLISQGISVLRIAGADGSETSVQLAKFELNKLTDGSGNPAGLGWPFGCHSTSIPITNQPYFSGCATRVGLARGDFFADALTSSVVTGGGAFGATSRHPSPIILAENPTTLGTFATAFFNAAGSPYGIDPFNSGLNPIPGSGSTITSILVFGGPLAIANSTIQAALTAISQG